LIRRRRFATPSSMSSAYSGNTPATVRPANTPVPGLDGIRRSADRDQQIAVAVAPCTCDDNPIRTHLERNSICSMWRETADRNPCGPFGSGKRCPHAHTIPPMGDALAPSVITAVAGFGGAALGYLASSQAERRRDKSAAKERAEARELQEIDRKREHQRSVLQLASAELERAMEIVDAIVLVVGVPKDKNRLLTAAEEAELLRLLGARGTQLRRMLAVSSQVSDDKMHADLLEAARKLSAMKFDVNDLRAGRDEPIGEAAQLLVAIGEQLRSL
jgi:hypothetical protein